jgi:hypothetical protein
MIDQIFQITKTTVCSRANHNVPTLTVWYISSSVNTPDTPTTKLPSLTINSYRKQKRNVALLYLQNEN